MRLFTGISLPEALLYSLDAFLAPLRPLAQIRWSPLCNLHITTRFIGEWPAESLPGLVEALSTLSSPSFELQVGGLGWFPSPQSPHVFWMGVHGDPAIAQLAAETDAILARLGHRSEDRPFRAHLTLARMRRESRLQNLRRTIEALPPVVFPPFTVTDFHLYQSEAGVYRKLETFNLVTSGARKIY